MDRRYIAIAALLALTGIVCLILIGAGVAS